MGNNLKNEGHVAFPSNSTIERLKYSGVCCCNMILLSYELDMVEERAEGTWQHIGFITVIQGRIQTTALAFMALRITL